MTPITPNQTMSIVKLLVEGKTPKEVAYLLNISVNPVYQTREKYFKELWVLKKHPSDDFKLV